MNQQKLMNKTIPFILLINLVIYIYTKEFWFGLLTIICYSIASLIMWYFIDYLLKNKGEEDEE